MVTFMSVYVNLWPRLHMSKTSQVNTETCNVTIAKMWCWWKNRRKLQHWQKHLSHLIGTLKDRRICSKCLFSIRENHLALKPMLQLWEQSFIRYTLVGGVAVNKIFRYEGKAEDVTAWPQSMPQQTEAEIVSINNYQKENTKALKPFGGFFWIT